MRAVDLEHHEVLQCDQATGLLRFAGDRVLLIDAFALGLLRKQLIETLGLGPARALLTQFGFAQGWRLGDSLEGQFDWDDEQQRSLAANQLLAMLGLGSFDPHAARLDGSAGATLENSADAEQHLLHFGPSEEPVCWLVCGLLSGFLSRAEGREIFVLEHRCLGAGASSCQLVALPRDAWAPELASALDFFEPNGAAKLLAASLGRPSPAKGDGAGPRRRGGDASRAGLVARSERMQALVDLAMRVAKVDATVLITGESGSGKERIARLVHEESKRAGGPFVAVNCGAITETLLETELFGHTRGAFTGATHDRPGLFEAAANGTLLLDEVGEVSAGMQVKLLRALQEHEVRRVGENKSRKIDVRIIAATNRDLTAAVASGAFRQDLYYRLKVVELHVPALRERRDDVLPLARVLLANAAARMQRPVTGLSPTVADRLLRSEWPGNVRQLENAMERAVALARGSRVEVDDLPADVCPDGLLPSGAIGGAVRQLDEIERDYILAALAVNDGNQTRTAEQLHIGAATLYRKLKRFGALGPRAGTRRKLPS